MEAEVAVAWGLAEYQYPRVLLGNLKAGRAWPPAPCHPFKPPAGLSRSPPTQSNRQPDSHPACHPSIPPHPWLNKNVKGCRWALHAGNGYVHVIDAALAPPEIFAPAAPPAPTAPGTFGQLSTINPLLVTSPPPRPAVYTNAPPPILTPLAAYYTAPPPPPSPPWNGYPLGFAPPPGTVGGNPGQTSGRGSCRAKPPDICGLCDYTYQAWASLVTISSQADPFVSLKP